MERILPTSVLNAASVRLLGLGYDILIVSLRVGGVPCSL
jgi:hypothetical protein